MYLTYYVTKKLKKPDLLGLWKNPLAIPCLPRYGPLTITLTLHVAGLLIVVATIAGLKAAFVAVAMATMAFEVGGPETGGVTARAATGGATTTASRRSDRNRIRG